MAIEEGRTMLLIPVATAHTGVAVSHAFALGGYACISAGTVGTNIVLQQPLVLVSVQTRAVSHAHTDAARLPSPV